MKCKKCSTKESMSQSTKGKLESANKESKAAKVITKKK